MTEEVQRLVDCAVDDYSRGCADSAASLADECIELCRVLGPKAPRDVHILYAEILVLKGRMCLESACSRLKDDGGIEPQPGEKSSQNDHDQAGSIYPSDSDIDYYERKHIVFAPSNAEGPDNLPELEYIDADDDSLASSKKSAADRAIQLFMAAKSVLVDLKNDAAHAISVEVVKVLVLLAEAYEFVGHSLAAHTALIEAVCLARNLLGGSITAPTAAPVKTPNLDSRSSGAITSYDLVSLHKKGLTMLADLAMNKHRCNEALEYYSEIRQLTERTFGRKSSFYGHVLFDIAKVHISINQKRAALNFLIEARTLLANAGMASTKAYGDILEATANVYHAIGDYHAAIALYQQAETVGSTQ